MRLHKTIKVILLILIIVECAIQGRLSYLWHKYHGALGYYLNKSELLQIDQWLLLAIAVILCYILARWIVRKFK